ncbi:hypothetical protein DL768_002151 [Monosporascus sp. mg162]|nr:hypothetical protein DL768_002151 [Monosporascus sp. mg162]
MAFLTLMKKQLTASKITFHVLFWAFHWFIFGYGWWKQAADERLAGLNTLQWSVWLSRGAGLVLAVDGTIILLPVCRTIMRTIRPKIRFLPLDENLWFHRQVAYAMLLYTIIHVSAHYVNFYNVEKPKSDQLQRSKFTTLKPEVLPAMLCFCACADFWGHCIGYQGWRWELFAGAFYLAERLYREIRAVRETKITRVVRHPYDVVEIQFEKPSFKYKAGQWLFLQIPSISRNQWHPFTITSCPYDPYVSVHVRQVGDFTRALGDAGGAGAAQAKLYEGVDPTGMYEVALQNGQQMPALRIDGPYGAPAEDVFENEIAVLIGTGIGVTPWASILKNIWHLRNSPNPPRRLRRVEFIWVCKDTGSFEWFQTLLSSLESQSAEAARIPGSNGVEFLKIHTYLTQKLDADTQQNIVLNSVGADHDPLTELKARTNFGRPNFTRIFEAMRDGILDRTYMNGLEGSVRTTVGVYFCGPSVAARDIKKAAKTATSREVHFRFWKEHF